MPWPETFPTLFQTIRIYQSSTAAQLRSLFLSLSRSADTWRENYTKQIIRSASTYCDAFKTDMRLLLRVLQLVPISGLLSNMFSLSSISLPLLGGRVDVGDFIFVHNWANKQPVERTLSLALRRTIGQTIGWINCLKFGRAKE